MNDANRSIFQYQSEIKNAWPTAGRFLKKAPHKLYMINLLLSKAKNRAIEIERQVINQLLSTSVKRRSVWHHFAFALAPLANEFPQKQARQKYVDHKVLARKKSLPPDQGLGYQ